MSDIVERLRGRIGPLLYQHDNGIDLTLEAADEIERRTERLLRLSKYCERIDTENERLRDALEEITSIYLHPHGLGSEGKIKAAHSVATQALGGH